MNCACGYDWWILFVGILIGIIVSAWVICWIMDWMSKPMNDVDIPTLTDEVER